jgi:hypothetical protein
MNKVKIWVQDFPTIRMNRVKVWLDNYINSKDPSVQDDFKHLDWIFRTHCEWIFPGNRRILMTIFIKGYDIYDADLFKSWWKNIVLVLNTIFMVWVTISCMFSLQLFLEDIERFVSCIFTFMVAAQVKNIKLKFQEVGFVNRKYF